MHQIRRHMKHISHPVIGDTQYGDGRHNRLFREQFGLRRLLLHCGNISLVHPRTGRPLTISAPVPPEVTNLFRALGWEASAEAADTEVGPPPCSAGGTGSVPSAAEERPEEAVEDPPAEPSGVDTIQGI
jgi:tRNA pseudouridine65 synthase